MKQCDQGVIDANMAEFGDASAQLRFVEPQAAAAAILRRQELLGELTGSSGGTISCLGTKPQWGPLSPGCAICSSGQWSCLFVNNICNGRCFYCPTTQTAKSEPTTNNLRFPNPQDYVDYLGVLGFEGASITGGEPLLTFDRTIQYVRRVKKRFGSAIHLWLYTNGLLATEEKIGQLADAGLDEIRFDISADHYCLAHLELAKGRIPTITVEIPAIPEDVELLRGLLPQLADSGVDHLNLHHMRCTPHNWPNLVRRPYTMLHGPKVTVLESELAALEIVVAAAQAPAAPAVNYCSYAYKSRFQGRAARRKAAGILVRPWEDVTEAGYIRSLCVKGGDQALTRCAQTLVEQVGDNGRWRREKDRGLLVGQELCAILDGDDIDIEVSYASAGLQNGVTYRGSHQKVALNRKRTIVAERQTVLANHRLSAAAFLDLLDAMTGQSGEAQAAGGELASLLPYERLESGLCRYY